MPGRAGQHWWRGGEHGSPPRPGAVVYQLGDLGPGGLFWLESAHL